MSFDLFLSYHHSDRESVEKVRQILNARGVSTFIDYKNLDLGLPWPQRLEQSLQSVRAVLVFVGAEMGRWQKREMYFALDLQTERERNENLFPVIPILLRGADLAPGFLFLNSWVDLRDDLTSPDAIDQLVQAVSGEPAPGPAPEPMPVSPYRELRAFGEEHSAFFYGREKLSKNLLEKVCGEKGMVAVIGPSGSGKSSVVHAGLLPLLRRQRPPAKTWDAISFKPDGDPFNRMARALVPLLEPDMSEIDRSIELTKLEKALRSGDTRLADLVARILEKSKGTDRFLIIIDQFEELITLKPKGSATDPNGDDSVSFVKVMMAAIKARAPLEFVVTLRADFYGDIIGLDRELSDRLEQSPVNVGAMDSAELESAIVIPARKVGLDFEHGLVQRLVNDVGHEPGQLPLLQFALWELWEKRQVQARLMTHAAYDKFGGVAKAINTVAHTKLASLNSLDQKSVRRIFTRLVRVTPRGEGGEARRRASLDEFNGPERKLISQFVDARLLVTLRDENTGEESVEVSHEALIREWDDLQIWLNEDREFLLWRQRLRISLAEWQRLNVDEGALLRGALLTEAESWRGRREDDLNEEEREYIDTGKQRLQKETLEADQRRTRQRRNRFLAFVGIAIAATLAVVQWDRAATARRIAQARSLLSPAVLIANNEPGKLDQAALLAIESLRLDDTPEAQSILRQAVAALPSEIDRVRIDCDGEASLSPQGKYVVCINNARRSVKLISLSTRKDERAAVTESEAISMAAASPDGKFLAVGLGSGGFHLFNDHGQVVARFENPRTDRSPDPDDIPDAVVAFSANGQRFAAGVVSGKKTAIHVFELARPEDRPSLFAINFPVFALTFSPEAGFLAALHEGQSETGVTIFDLTTNKELRTIRGGAAFRSLALSGGARVIALPTVDSSIRIKNTELVETVYGELKHQQDVNAVALTPDGMYAASGSEDGTARVMEIQGRPVALLPTGSPVQSVTFTQDFNLAVLSGDTVRIVSVFFGRPGFETKALNGAAISISPRGRY